MRASGVPGGRRRGPGGVLPIRGGRLAPRQFGANGGSLYRGPDGHRRRGHDHVLSPGGDCRQCFAQDLNKFKNAWSVGRPAARTRRCWMRRRGGSERRGSGVRIALVTYAWCRGWCRARGEAGTRRSGRRRAAQLNRRDGPAPPSRRSAAGLRRKVGGPGMEADQRSGAQGDGSPPRMRRRDVPPILLDRCE